MSFGDHLMVTTFRFAYDEMDTMSKQAFALSRLIGIIPIN